MEIRKLTHHDAAAYWSLRLESLQTEPLAFGKSAEEHAATTVEGVAARLREMPPDFTLGAFEGDALVGMATFLRERGRKDRHKENLRSVRASRTSPKKDRPRSHRNPFTARSWGFIDRTDTHLRNNAAGGARQLYRSFGFQSFGVELRALKVGSQYVDEEHMVLRLR